MTNNEERNLVRKEEEMLERANREHIPEILTALESRVDRIYIDPRLNDSKRYPITAALGDAINDSGKIEILDKSEPGVLSLQIATPESVSVLRSELEAMGAPIADLDEEGAVQVQYGDLEMFWTRIMSYQSKALQGRDLVKLLTTLYRITHP